ncbi:MAG TPA: deoxyribose-phosphate aldolase [Vulgatibacter sp.]|nr:deoxyribose-phosphate aldolase [Vulgatibacter sp.]
MKLASRIEHTLLRADARPADVERLCDEATEWGFAGVCVNSSHVERVAARLAGTGILPVAVAGFPLGASSTAAKAFEAEWAARHGAREIDVVIAVGLLLAGDRGAVLADLREVVHAVRPLPVKAILETCLLDREQNLAACAIAEEAGARFVKTSTGFAAGGATVEDVALLREAVGDRLGVKASGGIRTAADARAMVEAGADRIGASASVAIARGDLR